jgi:S-(hydroxymethyl)glutathione dehydrogenase/alcohol dehydrogenase
MRTRASAITSAPGEFETIEVELGEPAQDELRVKMAATGLCHSDAHLATGDLSLGIYPMIGGHEGAGVVDAVGPNTPGFKVGDHVVFSFLPSCGRCRWCASGQQNLCDRGAATMLGTRANEPGSFRFHDLAGNDVGQMAGLGTFSEYTVVSVDATIRVPHDLPLTSLCLLGCAVGTGMGAAINSAQVRLNDTVLIMGVGGVGINAVQGAAIAGAGHVIAVDPVPFKRETALKLGATEAFAGADEAITFACDHTNGQGADSVILTMGIVEPEDVGTAVSAVRKAGTVVLVGTGNPAKLLLPISMLEVAMFQKRIQGSLFGQTNARADVPKQIELYRAGRLKLDELVTATYGLDEVAQGYRDMNAGKNIRGVVVFD